MARHVHHYWKRAAILIGVVLIVQLFKSWHVHSQLEDVYLYDIRVSVRDEETGESVKNVTTHGPSSSSTDLIDQVTGAGGGLDGEVKIRGVAYQPRIFGFSAEGYRRADLEVTEQTKSHITIALKPKTPNKTQQAKPR